LIFSLLKYVGNCPKGNIQKPARSSGVKKIIKIHLNQTIRFAFDFHPLFLWKYSNFSRKKMSRFSNSHNSGNFESHHDIHFTSITYWKFFLSRCRRQTKLRRLLLSWTNVFLSVFSTRWQKKILCQIWPNDRPHCCLGGTNRRPLPQIFF